MSAVRTVVVSLALLFVGLAFGTIRCEPLLAQDKGKDKAAEKQPPIKWEYKVIDFRKSEGDGLEAALNKLGNDGWECVGAISQAAGGLPNSSVIAKLILKRPKA